ncbi:MAG: AraC family transcriptional regulator [Novosphingobium sp.]|uniref:AraC family transcriptional regulator n=1 Tax=Novosphingobium sp. TaxID=1874826 RepID=UPI0032B789C5
MAELVRVAALSGYFETMAGLGADPRPLLKAQGLSADLLANPEQLIPASAAIRLLECSAEASGCLTLGLRMAQGRALANLGASSLLIAHQPSLRHSLAALTEFRARINSTLVLHIEEHGGEAILREDFSLARPEPMRQSSNLALGVLTRLCGSVLGDGWAPRLACFSHQFPLASDLPLFNRLFRCPLQFSSEFNGLIVLADDLDRPNHRADTQLAMHARQLLETVMKPSTLSAAQDVGRLITLLLPSGRANIQTCAASLGVTVRTLQRTLDAEGSSFSELLNRVRMQLATQYLANPRMRITDIADMLGYSSIGAFSRWHAQIFGLPPRKMRKSRGRQESR